MLNGTFVHEPARCNAGQKVHTKGGFGSEFRRNVLDGAEEIPVGDGVGDFPTIGSFAVDPSFSFGVVFRTPSSAQHLTDLHDRQRPTHPVIPPFQIANQDPSCGWLTPAARVGVAVKATKRPDLNAASTSFRWALVSPA